MSKRTRAIAFIFLIAAVASCFAVTASADTGPKPSVNITFKNLPAGECWGTLLSSRDQYGPYYAYVGTEESKVDFIENEAAWQAFVGFSDADGYHFLQMTWDVGVTGEIGWTYYPPERFKILLWFPESGTFAESGVCERYAFDTYYTVDLAGVVTEGGVVAVTAVKSYDYTNELLSLFARIVVTVAIELFIALLFGFRARREVLIVLITNAVTQIGLNVALNLVAHYSGALEAIIWYIMLEIVVFIAEAAVYCTVLRKASPKPRRAWYYAVYALVANAVSFAAGWWIAYLMPSIF